MSAFKNLELNKPSSYSCDILIAGSGFAGSLTALILHQLGFRVCLVEKGQHPRFAIGESSTPIADMILRNLARDYDLPWLHKFSRYGTWQQSYPDIVCGLKRGFSYFKHYPEKSFTTDENHNNELLVAASADDLHSDTNWLRSDFDAFLVNKVQEYGITYLDLTAIQSWKKTTAWEFKAKRHGESLTIHSSFFIDATGNSQLLENLMNINSSAGEFLTHSYALFSHFKGVTPWSQFLQECGIATRDYPYNPDHSALHQILDEGWLWMLRFNNQRISMGFMLNGYKQHQYQNPTAEASWNKILNRYPSLKKLMEGASLAPEPGQIIQTGRLQRKLNHGFGHGWVALPHTIGFVDPLHSTGIAHTLTGVERVVNILFQYWNKPPLLNQNLRSYEQSVFQELKIIDQLVTGCYKTLTHFDLFNTWSMLYFTAAINYEQQRLKQTPPSHFLDANNPSMIEIVNHSYFDLMKIIGKQYPSQEDVNWFTQQIRKRIQPYNMAGLLDPSANNMYHHTAVEM